NGNLTISNTNFNNNTPNQDGGAILNNNGNLTISNTNFNNNTANNYGGAICNYGDIIVNSSSFINNNATTGGAIYNNVNANILLISNVMSGNNATLGCEIYNLGNINATYLSYLGNSTILANNNSYVVLFAILTDDNGNFITGQNISFYVNGEFVVNVSSIEGYANISYLINNPLGGVVHVTGSYPGSNNLIVNNGELLLFTTVNSSIKLDKSNYEVNDLVKGNITIVNTGNNTAFNVTVNVTYPSDFVLNSTNITVSHGYYDPTNQNWYIGNLASDEEATMTFTGKFTKTGKYTHTITISGNNFNNNTNTANTTITNKTKPETETEQNSTQKPNPNPKPIQEPNPTPNNNNINMKTTGIPLFMLLIALILAIIPTKRRKN
ncbi:MAG: hypothetical protein ACRCVG_00380, partial [Methanobacteriaceae archaeon]